MPYGLLSRKHGRQKMGILVFNDSKSVDGKIKMLVRRTVEKYLQKLEKFRIQSSLKVEIKKKISGDNE